MALDPAKQKHHYLPQFFFKLFEDRGHLEVYDIIEKIFHRGSCKDLCFVRNLYEDPSIENVFSSIEKSSHDSIWKIIKNKRCDILTVAEKVNIFQFIIFQHMRTPKAKDKYEKFFKYIIDELIRDLFRENIGKKPFITKDWVENGVMPSIDGPIFMTALLSILNTSYWYLADLVPVILINKTDKDFIFSDNPVIFYNSFFNYVDDLDMTYLFSPGLQIFTPLSKKIMLMLYDSKFYDSKSISVFNDVQDLPTGIISIMHEYDIDSLNTLQLLNCEKSIYFVDSKQSTYIKGLHSTLDASANSSSFGSRTYIIKDKSSKLDKKLSEFYIKGGGRYQLCLSFMPFVPNAGATETIGLSGFPIRSTKLARMIKEAEKSIWDQATTIESIQAAKDSI